MLRRKRSIFYRTINAKNLRVSRPMTVARLLLWVFVLLILSTVLGSILFEAGRQWGPFDWKKTEEKLVLVQQELSKTKSDLDFYKKTAEAADSALVIAKAAEQKMMLEVQRLNQELETNKDELAFFQKMSNARDSKNAKEIEIINMEAKVLATGDYQIKALIFSPTIQKKELDVILEWGVDTDKQQILGKETIRFSRYRRLDKTLAPQGLAQPKQIWLKIYDLSRNLKAQTSVNISR